MSRDCALARSQSQHPFMTAEGFLLAALLAEGRTDSFCIREATGPLLRSPTTQAQRPAAFPSSVLGPSTRTLHHRPAGQDMLVRCTERALLRHALYPDMSGNHSNRKDWVS
jgi:hypothetical protein